jgi:hypothetical protein
LQKLNPQATPRLGAWLKAQSVGTADAFPVASFPELMQAVAELSYANKDQLLFYRGQSRDFRNKAGASTIYPGIYRGERVSKQQLELSFDVLEAASTRLCTALERQGLACHRDVRRRRYIQWSILQHYQVCATPLLDITHSLVVACSFAFLEAKDEPDAHVLVFGLPYVTNRVSINSEQDIVNVRLLSICPPEALRPYYQEGYVAGTDEVTDQFDSKEELDFNQRLVAKFRLGDEKGFWRGGFHGLQRRSLYPARDAFEHLCAELRHEMEIGATAGRIGSFLKEWSSLEAEVVGRARQQMPPGSVRSMREALDVLQQTESLSPHTLSLLQQLRQLRNRIVHQPGKADPQAVIRGADLIRELRAEMERATKAPR